MTDISGTPILKIVEQMLSHRDRRLKVLEARVGDLEAELSRRRPTIVERAKGVLRAAWDGMPA